jgi:hypothetical protein
MNHDYILLDGSGSMGEAGKWGDSITGINTYVHGLAEKRVETGVTMAVFDKPNLQMEFQIVRDRIIPSTWRDVTMTEIRPRGWTPLNDAVLRIIEIAKRAGHQPRDHVAFVFVTDGMENASSSSRQDAKNALDECRKLGWEMIFIGNNFDNWTQAEGYGALRASSYASASANIGKTMGVMAANRFSKVSGQSATMDFSSEQKAELDKTNNGNS